MAARLAFLLLSLSPLAPALTQTGKARAQPAMLCCCRGKRACCCRHSGDAPGWHSKALLPGELSRHADDGQRRPIAASAGAGKREIEQSPGADLTSSLAMITDYTPRAYMVHDMLHMRGGHQVNWFLDGIPVVNTNIAANVAPLINPKNVEELEVERGGFSIQYVDRTYGFLNVVTPSGFESDREAELVIVGGNFNTTDAQISFAGHTQRLVWFASLDGNRSDLGLGNPTPAAIHDQESGFGGSFRSCIIPAQGSTALDRVRARRPLPGPQRSGRPGSRHSRPRP